MQFMRQIMLRPRGFRPKCFMLGFSRHPLHTSPVLHSLTPVHRYDMQPERNTDVDPKKVVRHVHVSQKGVSAAQHGEASIVPHCCAASRVALVTFLQAPSHSSWPRSTRTSRRSSTRGSSPFSQTRLALKVLMCARNPKINPRNFYRRF